MSQKTPKVSQKESKMGQKWAKGCQKEAKWRQKDAKGSQKGAKGSQKGAQKEPNGDENASKNWPSEKVAKREPEWCPHPELLAPFWSHFPLKIDEKIDAKIDAEKVMKIDETSMRKWSDIYRKSI